MTALLVIILALVALVIAFLTVYRRLVKLSVAGDQAWSNIELELQKRYDLVPELVETVRSCAKGDMQIFERVIEAKGKATQSSNPGEKSLAENILQSTLRSLCALAENYPELKSNERFLSLQDELVNLEDQIQLARRNYNAVVRELNNRIETAPGHLVASLMGLRKREYFELEAPKR